MENYYQQQCNQWLSTGILIHYGVSLYQRPLYQIQQVIDDIGYSMDSLWQKRKIRK